VFLTDDRAYKLKKPYRWPFVDLGTPRRRGRHCREAVRLNRRLAPTVYRGAVPLVVDRCGQLVLGGRGRIVDWLVEMERLPAGPMLDRRIAAGGVERADLVRLGTALGSFYAAQRTEEVPPQAYVRRIRDELVAGARDLEERPGLLPHALVLALACELERFCQGEAELLAARAGAGRLVEGHGDLRPEHVCLLPVPVVIDCLEFDRDLRVLDPVDELSFLAMECARLGAPEVGPEVLAVYERVTGDEPPPALARFYRAYRAFARARVTLWHLRDAHVEHPRRWVLRATDYLRLAATELAAEV
jgi:aminoglycoside phosphotransferase family enzyme